MDEKDSCGTVPASRCRISSFSDLPMWQCVSIGGFSLNFEQSRQLMQGIVRPGSYLGLERIGALLHALGDPQEKLHCIHVAGTNGKGSTVAMTASILQAAGYRTGRYVSPALFEFNERMAVDGVCVSDGELAGLAAEVKKAAEGLEPPTEFEFVTAMAFVWFCRQHCDFVVLEVGMGGRLDATNIIMHPVTEIITAIGLDHIKELGPDLASIAAEKAGIIKPDSDVVSYVQEPEAAAVIAKRCAETGSRLHLAEFAAVRPRGETLDGQVFDYKTLQELQIPLLGVHQLRNAAVVLKNVEVLRRKGIVIPDSAVRGGLRDTVWRGRLDLLRRDPPVLFDGAHNKHAVDVLVPSLKRLFPGQKLIFVMGVLADKDFGDMIGELAEIAACFITVTPPNPRALPAAALAEKLAVLCDDVTAAESIPQGLTLALSRQRKTGLPVCCCGSLYSAAPIYDYFEGIGGYCHE